MTYQMFHFRGSNKIFESKSMVSDLAMTSEYVFNAVKYTSLPQILLRTALDQMGWNRGDTWNIVGCHRYRYAGYKHGVGIEACLSAYMYLVEGLFRLQLGFDKGQIDAGILLLTVKGALPDQEKDLKTLITKDMDALAPTISLPVCVCLYDFSEHPDENGF